MKKHASLKKLREAKELADELSIERGLRTKDSAVEEIRNTITGPILPGIPNYLPYPWTINNSKRVMYDMLVLWKNTMGREREADDAISFFKFVLKEMREQKELTYDEIQKGRIMKRYDIKLLWKLKAVDGVYKFFVDAFAVSVIVRKNESVVDFAEWFDEWTKDLLNQWDENQRNIDGKTPKVHRN